MNRGIRLLSLSLAVSSLVGCEEDSPSASSTASEAGTTEVGTTEAASGGLEEETETQGDTDTEGGGGPDIGEGVAWPDKSPEQRGAYMGLVVLPAVTELWQQSPNAEQEVTCATCHGPGAAEGDFAMPNAALTPLDPANDFEAHQDSAAFLEFMMTQLTPEMTELLDAEPFDFETNEGFSCFACHTPAG